MSLDVEFASDNHSGVHPEVMNALMEANKGYSISYGEDEYTLSAKRLLRKVFGSNSDSFFVYNGTAANILGLKTVTKSFHSILCASSAHLTVHECCGPERFTGCKLSTIPTEDGKLTPALIEPYLMGMGDVHMAQPKIISITQSTELGTTYTIDELKEICRFAHQNNLLVHVDGARLCNAAVYLRTGLKEITKDVGVDVLSFGGTKNGLMYGEAVVFLDKSLAADFEFYRKQGMQLTSKMRFISAQFNMFLQDDLWKKNAEHANQMACYLEKELKMIPHIKLVQKVEANMVFVRIELAHMKKIRKKFYFHVLEQDPSVARLVCSFNTTKNHIDGLIDGLKQICD